MLKSLMDVYNNYRKRVENLILFCFMLSTLSHCLVYPGVTRSIEVIINVLIILTAEMFIRLTG